MSLQLPQRARRTALAVTLGFSLLMLGACSEETQSQCRKFAMPANSPGTEQAVHIADLWKWAWIAALITGAIVWGLIFWVIFVYRRRSEDEIPVQTRYNLPLEIFYTVAPVMMVVVFFVHTVRVQNIVLDDPAPDNIIEVTGQQWQWTFNHGVREVDVAADEDTADEEYPYSEYAYEIGTASYIPTLWLPVDETTRFNLHSPDVIHDFGVPGFLIKMDVIPGRVNSYQVTPTEIGDYLGKCYELCGVYHSRMLFKVKVVSREDYDAYLEGLVDAGNDSELPLIGGDAARTQAGLDTDETEGEGE